MVSGICLKNQSLGDTLYEKYSELFTPALLMTNAMVEADDVLEHHFNDISIKIEGLCQRLLKDSLHGQKHSNPVFSFTHKGVVAQVAGTYMNAIAKLAKKIIQSEPHVKNIKGIRDNLITLSQAQEILSDLVQEPKIMATLHRIALLLLLEDDKAYKLFSEMPKDLQKLVFYKMGSDTEGLEEELQILKGMDNFYIDGTEITKKKMEVLYSASYLAYLGHAALKSVQQELPASKPLYLNDKEIEIVDEVFGDSSCLSTKLKGLIKSYFTFEERQLLSDERVSIHAQFNALGPFPQFVDFTADEVFKPILPEKYRTCDSGQSHEEFFT
jgi:hypothetical protein